MPCPCHPPQAAAVFRVPRYRPVMFLRHVVNTPLGPLHAVHDRDVLHALAFDVNRLDVLLRRRGLDPVATEAPAPCAPALHAWFDGDLTALDTLPVHIHGTTFERSVWAALRRLAPGSTATYGQLATRLGRPAAARAVGRANGANPLVIVVPCHRLTAADGGLVGFAGGIVRKAWLRDHEAHTTLAGPRTVEP